MFAQLPGFRRVSSSWALLLLYISLDKILEKSIEIGLGSTIHGIPNIFKTDRICVKIMWLVLFLLSSSAGIYLVIQSFISYFSFDVVTSIKVVKEIPTEFPAITFYILRNKFCDLLVRLFFYLAEVRTESA